MDETDNDLTLIKKKEVCRLTTYCPAHIDRLEAAGKFPTRVRLGQARVAWVKSDVIQWIKARIEESRNNPKAPPKHDEDDDLTLH